MPDSELLELPEALDNDGDVRNEVLTVLVLAHVQVLDLLTKEL